MDFYLDELRQAFYKIAASMLENLENLRAKGEEFLKQQHNQAKHEIILRSAGPDPQVLQIGSDWVEFLRKIDLTNMIPDIIAIVRQTNPKEKNLSVDSLLKSYEGLCNLYKTIMFEKIENIDVLKHADSLGIVLDQDRESLVNFTVKSTKSLRVEFSFENNPILNEYQFIDCAMETWNKILKASLNPTPNEYFMINLAYRILRRSPGGTSLSRRSRFMGVPGFHPDTQTYMSLTDPGPGHFNGTVTQLRWMNKGVIVHLEHLERTTDDHNKEPTRDQIESYRIPSIKWFLMTRLHVADIAPQTLYIGRRLKDSDNFDNDLLRVSRIFSACLNNMFNAGTSECKLSMEYLSTYETLKHMRSIRAEVTRNPYQILSAAWNLNRKLKDDYPLALLKSYFGGKYEQIEKLNFERYTTASDRSDRFEIAKMAIAYTKLGGFDKVTWDGASDTYPSRCIVPYQLTLPQLFELNHIAHSLGLITYVSAGFKFDQIKIAVFTGVDGVGIGGAQVLRLMNPKTKVHGAYQQEHIDRILEKRDEAAKSLYGKCVNLMSRLDSMYYEGSLSPQEKQHRDNLFRYLNDRYSRIQVFDDKLAPDYQNMLTEDNADLRNILNTLDDITKLNTTMNNESDRTIYLDRFKRVLRNFDTALIRTAFLEDTDPELLRGEIQKVVDNNVEQAAYDYWISYPWSEIIGNYQKNLLKEFIKSSFN